MSRHAYASRDSTPSHTLLDQKLDPRVIVFRTKLSFTLSTANEGVLFGIITVEYKFEAEHAKTAASPA